MPCVQHLEILMNRLLQDIDTIADLPSKNEDPHIE